MKTIIQSVIAASAICLLAGCETTGLSSRERSGVSYPNYILSLQSGGTNAPAQKPVTPIRLAIAQVGESAPPAAMLDRMAGQKALVASVVALPLPGEPENHYDYNRSNHPTDDYAARIKSVCSLAQSAGADYVFLFGGNIDFWRKNNALSFFDITLIGGMILPGGEINIEGKGAGALIEAATGRPVLFVNADAKTSASSPDYLADGKTTEMRAQVRDELIGKLTGELLEKLAESSISIKTTN